MAMTTTQLLDVIHRTLELLGQALDMLQAETVRQVQAGQSLPPDHDRMLALCHEVNADLDELMFSGEFSIAYEQVSPKAEAMAYDALSDAQIAFQQIDAYAVRSHITAPIGFKGALDKALEGLGDTGKKAVQALTDVGTSAIWRLILPVSVVGGLALLGLFLYRRVTR